MDLFSNIFVKHLEHYKVHILVFLLAFLVAITISHPAFLLTDEWVTANQLSQLNAGHQVILNEGKYGSFENGTPSSYFTLKQNYLAYSLVYPIISLPSEKLVYFFGDNFIFLLVYLWTFLLIALALTLNAFFPQYTRMGNWRWTSGLIVIAFAGFFLNLLFFSSFSLNGKDSYPEIMAIVFTNIILFACLAVMVYEILRMIFQQSSYALFGTIVCVSCSSYLFWTNFCKDHALVAFLFTAVLLMIIKFLHTENPWNLAGGFFLSGLLAWARPELGFFIFIVMCSLVVFFSFYIYGRTPQSSNRFLLFLSPLFVVIGAIPFFINNYLYTKNPFIPVSLLWNTGSSSSAVTITETVPTVTIAETASSISITNIVPLQQNTPDTLGLLSHILHAGINIQPSTFFTDLYGIFFHPLSGSMGILPLVPVFLVAVMMLPVLLMREKIQFTRKEHLIIYTLLLLALGIFCAYIRGISGMNTSIGIFPDIRYLSPIYLPLTIIGLIIVRKIPSVSDKPLELMAWMCAFWIILIPSSLILIRYYYPVPAAWKDVFPLLDTYATVLIFLSVLLFIVFCYRFVVSKRSITLTKFFLSLICSLPLIWQIDASFVALLFSSGFGGYLLWIPVLFKIFGLII